MVQLCYLGTGYGQSTLVHAAHLRRRHGSKGLGAGSLAGADRWRWKEHGRVSLWHGISIKDKRGQASRPSYHNERHDCARVSIGGRSLTWEWERAYSTCQPGSKPASSTSSFVRPSQPAKPGWRRLQKPWRCVSTATSHKTTDDSPADHPMQRRSVSVKAHWTQSHHRGLAYLLRVKIWGGDYISHAAWWRPGQGHLQQPWAACSRGCSTCRLHLCSSRARHKARL